MAREKISPADVDPAPVREKISPADVVPLHTVENGTPPADAPEPEAGPSFHGLVPSDAARLFAPAAPLMAAKDMYDVARGDPEKTQKLRAFMQQFTLGKAGGIVGEKEAYQRASAEQPVMGAIGAMALPIPGAGKLKALKGATGVAARLALNSAVGAGISDIAESSNDNPDYLKSSAIGGGAGLLGSAAGEGLTRYFGGKAAKATADALAHGAANKTEQVEGAVRSLGGVTQTAHRALENITNNLEHGTPEEQAAIREWLKAPEQDALRRQILLNSFERAKGGMAAIDKARGEISAAKAIDPDAFAQESLGGTLKRAVLPRVKTIAERAIPAAIGAATGGGAGVAGGALLGGAIGKPGTIVANLMKDPNFQRHVYGAAEKLAGIAPALGTKEEIIRRIAERFVSGE